MSEWSCPDSDDLYSPIKYGRSYCHHPVRRKRSGFGLIQIK